MICSGECWLTSPLKVSSVRKLMQSKCATIAKLIMQIIAILLVLLHLSFPVFAFDSLKRPSREDLCKEITNNTCDKLLESAWCSQLPSKVLRDGRKLILALGNNQKIIKVDTPAEKSEGFYDSLGNPNRNYFFAEYFDKEKYFLVRVLYWEDADYELINERNGDSLTLAGYPLFSPDRLHFVVTSTVYGDELTDKIEIWTVVNSHFEKEITFSPKRWPLILAVWDSPISISLYKRKWSKNKGEHAGENIGRIIYDSGTWKVIDKFSPFDYLH